MQSVDVVIESQCYPAQVVGMRPPLQSIVAMNPHRIWNIQLHLQSMQRIA